ncbi:hypothetical protein Esi_0046_0019 [Ectocarpus siliculosus]|uniref:Uncharacterized protein n=1 Tax=Ectocarpus siliculosus TaxID=2880 RepID=D7G1T7_ECTSI|nr:hypothetical protein Esi_0046_0019 [Ectocarpus siliculosus]|eukprot:CBJ48663.1 hypothetical protein Esi_0046_0019 [Ectocarpus siliculosus]
MQSALMAGGLTPALRQLKDCRHTFPSSKWDTRDSQGAPRHGQGCLTCNGPRPERPTELEPNNETGTGDFGAILNGIEEGGRVERCGGDSRPKLVPGAMLTFSNTAVAAVKAFAEEVLAEEDPPRRATKAAAIVKEATTEVSFANRRNHPRTEVLVTRLQAVVRGWLARRLARVLLLRGGCRRELDVASGAWQYVWSHRAAVPGAPGAAATAPGRASYAGGIGGGGYRSPACGGDGGEGLFRTWYPPALLKNESLPSPRAAARRVEGEGRKREARLALANSLLDDQRAELNRRDARAARLLALVEVVKLVERAMASLEEAALTCFGTGSEPLAISVKVLHPRGGEPGDGAREAVVTEIMSAWHRIDAQVREQEEAARLRAERTNDKGKSPKTSPNRGGGVSARRTPRSGSREGRGKSTGRREAKLSVPTTNENLAAFEQIAARLLARRRVRGGGLSSPEEASARLHPRGFKIQVFPPWALASHRFIALVHRGSLVAVSQASPFVFWENLADRKKTNQLIADILGPFLENPDLLKAAFADEPGERASVPATKATSAGRSTTNNAVSTARETPGDGAGGDGEQSTSSSVAEAGDTGVRQIGRENEEGSAAAAAAAAADGGMWGYRSSLSSKGCWKIDARAVARRDSSLKLGFDSVAFDLFVLPDEKKGGKKGGQEPPAAPSVGKQRHATRVNDHEEDESSSPRATRAVVTNAVPFRLADGLPRELGPLLFEDTSDASLLAGDAAEDHPQSRGAKRKPEHPRVTVSDPELVGSRPEEAEEETEEEEGYEWERKKDPRSAGKILSHTRRGSGPSEAAVEVRIRGETLGADQLARAGLPHDLFSLVVDERFKVTNAATAGDSKSTRGRTKGRRKE